MSGEPTVLAALPPDERKGCAFPASILKHLEAPPPDSMRSLALIGQHSGEPQAHRSSGGTAARESSRCAA